MGGNSTVEYLGLLVVDHLVEYDGRYYPPPRSAAFRVRCRDMAQKMTRGSGRAGSPTT